MEWLVGCLDGCGVADGERHGENSQKKWHE